MRRVYWILMLVLMAALAAPAGAKGVVDKVTLVGPHWYGEVEITDPDLLEYLSLGAFADFEQELERPPLVSVGYLMTRFFEYDGELQMLDQVMYFPGVEPGEGVVYYIEMNDANGPYDGRWFQVRPESEAALLTWLSDEGIIPASITFEPPEIDSRTTDQTLLVGGGMLLVGLLGGVALGRREKP